MKSQKTFFTLFLLTCMFLALSAAQAQTNGAAEWKKRVAARIASGVRPQPAAQTEAANSTVESAETDAEASEARQGKRAEPERNDRLNDFRRRQQNALAGTWDLTLTFSDGSKVTSTLTVIPGREDGEGSVIHAAEASLLLPNPTTPEQGAWEHLGGLRFVASYQGYAVDEKLEKPAGKIGFRHAIRVSVDQESFTGRAVFEVLDTEGHVVFSDNIQTHGVRRHPVAP